MTPYARSERLARICLALGALAFIAIGLAFLLGPERMGRYVGLTLSGVTADNDVRAVYGGLQLACGIGLALAATRASGLRTALGAQMLLFSGLAFGRFVSLGLAGIPDALALGLHASELVAIACSATCLHALPSGDER